MTVFDEVAENIRDRHCVLFLGAEGSLSQRAYAYICAACQYDVPLVEGLLVPALDCGWEDFLRDIRKGQAEYCFITPAEIEKAQKAAYHIYCQ
jgi:hypothetical protein